MEHVVIPQQQVLQSMLFQQQQYHMLASHTVQLELQRLLKQEQLVEHILLQQEL